VRLLDIAGVDLNTCGGTHVANTSEIQAIKLTGTEPMRGGTRLFYLAGGRVLRRLELALARERDLTQRLSCGPEDHPAAVERLLDEAREQRRDRRALLQELAVHLGQSLIAEPGVASLHRSDGEMEFLHAIALAVREQQPDKWALLTGGERAGVFILLGPADSVASMGPFVADLLEGRGGGAKGIFQGKASRLDRRQEALRELSNRAE
jgi:alanyl-tRNA synthetase